MGLEIKLFPKNAAKKVEGIDKMVIPAVDGSVTIASVILPKNKRKWFWRHWISKETVSENSSGTRLRDKVFSEDSDPIFKRIDYASRATEETKLEMYEQNKHAIIQDIFKAISSDFNSLCLTQHQIVECCKKYKKLLRWPTYFLININKLGEEDYEDGIYVVEINTFRGGFKATIIDIDDKLVLKVRSSKQKRKIVSEGKRDYIIITDPRPRPAIIVPIH